MFLDAGRKPKFRLFPFVMSAAMALPASFSIQTSAFASSDLQNIQLVDDAGGMPMPEPLVDSSKDQNPPVIATDPKSVEIISDLRQLPEPVRKMREEIIKAASAADLKAIAALMNAGPTPTDIGPDDSGNSTEKALKEMSGDGEGLEILSIILDLFQANAAHVNAGTPDEAYVWPYFAETDINKLTPPQKVELMRIVTAGDLADMTEYGGYNFYRIGISPDGHWKFFLSGN